MKKNLSVEILRILSMIMIIMLHLLLNCNILGNDKLNNFESFIINLIEGICVVASNLYVLISGYFLTNKNFNIHKIFKILFKVWFYQIIIGGGLILFKKIPLSIENIVHIFFPIINQNYWFINSYLILLFLYPFINILINNMNQKQHKELLISLFVINCLISFITKDPVSGVKSGYSVVWFINLYLTSSYIKRYKLNVNKLKSILIYLVGTLFLPCSVFIINLLSKKLYILNNYKYLFYDYNSPIVYLNSVILFYLFLNIDKKYSNSAKKIILFFSTSTFSVYLIHENIFIRDILWHEIINSSNLLCNSFYLVLLFFTVILIFLFCVLIDNFFKFIFNFILKKIIKNQKQKL